MSSLLSQAKARSPRRVTNSGRTGRLTLVPRAVRRTPKVPFVVLVLFVLGGGLVGLLVLNTSLQQGAFYEASLQGQQNGLATKQEDLRLKVAALRDPQRLAREAQSLGMVPNTNPAFIDLGDGSVLGDPRPATAGTGPQLTVPTGHGVPDAPANPGVQHTNQQGHHTSQQAGHQDNHQSNQQASQ
ncbi:MAG: hypothetical protein ABJA86_02415 [Nocardioidaceae bacterium]